MSRSENPIYVCDLDGTLLRGDGTLSGYSRDVLRRLLDAGLNFTVASARAVNEIRPVLGGLPISLPVIAVNGAFLSDYAAGRHIVVNGIGADLAADILGHIRKRRLCPFVRIYDGRKDLLWFEQIANPAMQRYYDALSIQDGSRPCRCDSLADKLGRTTAVSFALMSPVREPIEDMHRLLGRLFPGRLENFFFENPYSPNHWWLTIHDRKACKSIAIRELLGITGFKKSQLTVFGDHINDIKMFRHSGRAIAVENAHPDLKPYADEIIGSNDCDAVVKYLEDIYCQPLI